MKERRRASSLLVVYVKWFKTHYFGDASAFSMRGSGVLVGALVLALATGVSRLDPAEVAPSAPALCAKPATLKVRTRRLFRGLRGAGPRAK